MLALIAMILATVSLVVAILDHFWTSRLLRRIEAQERQR